MVSLVQKFGPIMNEGGSVLSLTYIASEMVIPGYGGGMSSAKVRGGGRRPCRGDALGWTVDLNPCPQAALESDTRVLAFEAGRKYKVRVNTIRYRRQRHPDPAQGSQS